MTTFLYAVVLWFGVHGCFVAVMAAKQLADENKLTAYWKIMMFPFALVGIALDLVYSLTFGWVMFVEHPRIELFTTKLHRHKLNNGWRRGLADWFCKNLNLFDPGHC